jgi:hypothetical protein
MDSFESKTLEPRRGPGRIVSSGIPAVDDHRPVAVDLVGLFVKLAEGMTDGPGKVILRILFRRQNLDELRTALDHLLDGLAIDQRRHKDILRAHVVKLREVRGQGQQRIELGHHATRLQCSHHEA